MPSSFTSESICDSESYSQAVYSYDELKQIFKKNIPDEEVLVRIIGLKPDQIKELSCLINNDLEYAHNTRLRIVDIIYASCIFLNNVIQLSYDKKGSNNFLIHVNKFLPKLLGYELKGTATRPISLEIDGYTGFHFGLRASYCNFRIDGEITDKLDNEITNCVFSTSNKKTYKKLLRYVPRQELNFYGKPNELRNNVVYLS